MATGGEASLGSEALAAARRPARIHGAVGPGGQAASPKRAPKKRGEKRAEILTLSGHPFMRGQQRRFMFVNPELARYYGTSKAEMELQKETDTFYNPHKGQTDRFQADDERILSDQEPAIREAGLVIDAEEIMHKGTGETRLLKTTKKLFMYPSREPKKHVLGISTDITEALRKTKAERGMQVDAHVTLRQLLGPFSSVQDLVDFRSKLPGAFLTVNTQYKCIASGVLSTVRAGEHTEHVVQAYASRWRQDFFRLPWARLQGNIRRGITTIAEDPLLRELVGTHRNEPCQMMVGQFAGTPFGAFLSSTFSTQISSNCSIVLAAGISHASGAKRLSDLITFFVLPVSAFNTDELLVRSLLYFVQRFTDSLTQFYRNSELYTERKEFLTDVTHQLVTPLVNTIDTCTSTIERLAILSDDQVADRMCEARGLVRHCAMFTRSFLAASQSDEVELVSSTELNETSVKVTRLMIEVGRDFRASAHTKGLKLHVHEHVLDHLGYQELDEEWVRHALMNIVDNAIKYTAARSGRTVRLFGDLHPNEFALCVQNPSCIPIRKEFEDRIFDRWFRAPEAEEEEVQGTGIGLALARAVVVAHGGRIIVEQEPLHNGAYETSFRLWFPSSRNLKPSSSNTL